MRKIIALLMVIAMMIPLAVVATAAENTTTLTVQVPAANYELNIPFDQPNVEFGADIYLVSGSLSADSSSGFSPNKHLDVTVTYDAFRADGISSTIPYTLAIASSNTPLASGSSVRIPGNSNGQLNDYPVVDGKEVTAFVLLFEEEAWNKALAGTYTSTLTFTAEIVVE